MSSSSSSLRSVLLRGHVIRYIGYQVPGRYLTGLDGLYVIMSQYKVLRVFLL